MHDLVSSFLEKDAKNNACYDELLIFEEAGGDSCSLRLPHDYDGNWLRGAVKRPKHYAP